MCLLFDITFLAEEITASIPTVTDNVDKSLKCFRAIISNKCQQVNDQGMDIQSSENVLLLGAGFTKNFGGLLAEEMWAEIFNHEKIQAHPRIRKMMMKDFDYESVYYSVLEGFKDGESLFPPVGFTHEEKDAITKATKSAYEYIDYILREHIINHPYPNKLKYVNDLIFQLGSQGYIFMKPSENGIHGTSFIVTKNKSFIFTLNQDLFFERLYTNCFHAELSIPGIDNNPEWFTTYYNKPLEESDYCKLPNEEKLNNEDILLEGNYLLVKLHGSYNWTSFDGSDIMVIGRGKKEKIQKEPLLKRYFDIFDYVLSHERHRLFIIGYGFGDKHINEIISKAVTKNELKIYILSPESPKKLKEKLCEGLEKSEDTISIWKGISGYSQCVEDVLINNDFKNKAKKEHFHKVFFGEDV